MHKFNILSGNPSYISYADGDQITEIICILSEAFRKWQDKVPYIVIAGKHGNPCGAAIDWTSPDIALTKALLGNTVAIMGGEIITNFPIDKYLGELLLSPPKGIDIGRKNWGLDIVFAPEFSEDTIEIVGRREKRRLLANPALVESPLTTDPWMFRKLRGSWLRQKVSPFILTPDEVQYNTGASLSETDFSTLLLAWAVCWRASSNTVTLAKDMQLIGVGCGQQDQIECVRLCINRARAAGHSVKNAFFASDAFFPYATSKGSKISKEFFDSLKILLECVDADGDPAKVRRILTDDIAGSIIAQDKREGTELLLDAGCKGGVVPADGQNLEKVQAFFKENGLSVCFVEKNNRGFSKH